MIVVDIFRPQRYEAVIGQIGIVLLLIGRASSLVF